MSNIIEFFREMPRRKKITLLLTSIIVIVLTILFFIFEKPIMRGNLANNNIIYDGQNMYKNKFYSKHLKKKKIK
jgi:hypothetical protein